MQQVEFARYYTDFEKLFHFESIMKKNKLLSIKKWEFVLVE
jgi:hypothetical protein